MLCTCATCHRLHDNNECTVLDLKLRIGADSVHIADLERRLADLAPKATRWDAMARLIRQASAK